MPVRTVNLRRLFGPRCRRPTMSPLLTGQTRALMKTRRRSLSLTVKASFRWMALMTRAGQVRTHWTVASRLQLPLPRPQRQPCPPDQKAPPNTGSLHTKSPVTGKRRARRTTWSPAHPISRQSPVWTSGIMGRTTTLHQTSTHNSARPMPVNPMTMVRLY